MGRTRDPDSRKRVQRTRTIISQINQKEDKSKLGMVNLEERDFTRQS